MKKLSNSFLLFLAAIALFSCSQSENDTYTYKQQYDLAIDSLILPLDRFSGKGRLEIYEDTILYLDELYAQATLYTLDGDSVGRNLNKGRNYDEIPVIKNYVHLPDGSHLLMEDWNFYRYNKNWKFEGMFRIKWQGKVGYNDLMLYPEKYADKPDMYETAYIHPQIGVLTDSTILFNIDTEHMKFNAFTTAGYYKEARTLAELSLKTGKVKQVFMKRSPAYQQYSFVPHLIGQYFASDDSYFYVGHEVDPKIYVYDRDFKPVTAFGMPGIGMNTDYKESNTVETAYDNEAFHASRTTEGYYTHLWYYPEKDLLFRTYTTGGKYNRMNQNPKRLQIYEDKKLVADVDVPGRFRVLAYRDPYFYAEGIMDERNSRLGVYRFQLKELDR